MEVTGNAVETWLDQLYDDDLRSVWDDIESVPEDTDSDLWKKKLQKLAADYAISSRFALIRIIYSRSRGEPVSSAQSLPDREWEYPVGGKPVILRSISLQSVEDMDAAELGKYESILTAIASKSVDFDKKSAKELICRAMQSSKKTKLLTREEAFSLGHLLGFSLYEMNWFLLRVFDFEEGIQQNSSHDLIHAYCILTKSGEVTAKKLITDYSEKAQYIEKKLSLRPSDWTQNAGNALDRIVAEATRYPDEGNDRFLEWLLQKAPYLDLPSRSATELYRDLAQYAFDLSTEEAPEKWGDNDRQFILKFGEKRPLLKKNYPESSQMHAELMALPKSEIAMHERWPALCDAQTISEGKCYSLAKALIYEQHVLTESEKKDIIDDYAIITILPNGKATPSGTINANRDRMIELLAGELPVQKCDIIYLLFFIFNLSWQYSVLDSSNVTVLYNRMMDYFETVQHLLKKAQLPEFYPPHLLEQSLMLSIIAGKQGHQTEDGNWMSPAQVYFLACETLRETRNRLTAQEQNAKVAAYLELKASEASPPTPEEYAKAQGIKPKSFVSWLAKAESKVK